MDKNVLSDYNRYGRLPEGMQDCAAATDKMSCDVHAVGAEKQCAWTGDDGGQNLMQLVKDADGSAQKTPKHLTAYNLNLDPGIFDKSGDGDDGAGNDAVGAVSGKATARDITPEHWIWLVKNYYRGDEEGGGGGSARGGGTETLLRARLKRIMAQHGVSAMETAATMNMDMKKAVADIFNHLPLLESITVSEGDMLKRVTQPFVRFNEGGIDESLLDVEKVGFQGKASDVLFATTATFSDVMDPRWQDTDASGGECRPRREVPFMNADAAAAKKLAEAAAAGKIFRDGTTSQDLEAPHVNALSLLASDRSFKPAAAAPGLNFIDPTHPAPGTMQVSSSLHACWMALRNAASSCLFGEGRSAGTSDTPQGKALMRALRHAQSNLRQAIQRISGSEKMKTEAEVRAFWRHIEGPQYLGLRTLLYECCSKVIDAIHAMDEKIPDAVVNTILAYEDRIMRAVVQEGSDKSGVQLYESREQGPTKGLRYANFNSAPVTRMVLTSVGSAQPVVHYTLLTAEEAQRLDHKVYVGKNMQKRPVAELARDGNVRFAITGMLGEQLARYKKDGTYPYEYLVANFSNMLYHGSLPPAPFMQRKNIMSQPTTKAELQYARFWDVYMNLAFISALCTKERALRNVRGGYSASLPWGTTMPEVHAMLQAVRIGAQTDARTLGEHLNAKEASASNNQFVISFPYTPLLGAAERLAASPDAARACPSPTELLLRSQDYEGDKSFVMDMGFPVDCRTNNDDSVMAAVYAALLPFSARRCTATKLRALETRLKKITLDDGLCIPLQTFLDAKKLEKDFLTPELFRTKINFMRENGYQPYLRTTLEDVPMPQAELYESTDGLKENTVRILKKKEDVFVVMAPTKPGRHLFGQYVLRTADVFNRGMELKDAPAVAEHRRILVTDFDGKQIMNCRGDAVKIKTYYNNKYITNQKDFQNEEYFSAPLGGNPEAGRRRDFDTNGKIEAIKQQQRALLEGRGRRRLMGGREADTSLPEFDTTALGAAEATSPLDGVASSEDYDDIGVALLGPGKERSNQLLQDLDGAPMSKAPWTQGPVMALTFSGLELYLRAAMRVQAAREGEKGRLPALRAQAHLLTSDGTAELKGESFVELCPTMAGRVRRAVPSFQLELLAAKSDDEGSIEKMKKMRRFPSGVPTSVIDPSWPIHNDLVVGDFAQKLLDLTCQPVKTNAGTDRDPCDGSAYGRQISAFVTELLTPCFDAPEVEKQWAQSLQVKGALFWDKEMQVLDFSRLYGDLAKAVFGDDESALGKFIGEKSERTVSLRAHEVQFPTPPPIPTKGPSDPMEEAIPEIASDSIFPPVKDGADVVGVFHETPFLRTVPVLAHGSATASEMSFQPTEPHRASPELMVLLERAHLYDMNSLSFLGAMGLRKAFVENVLLSSTLPEEQRRAELEKHLKHASLSTGKLGKALPCLNTAFAVTTLLRVHDSTTEPASGILAFARIHATLSVDIARLRELREDPTESTRSDQVKLEKRIKELKRHVAPLEGVDAWKEATEKLKLDLEHGYYVP